MLDPRFVFIGTLINSVASLSYFYETLKGKVKPNRVSFLLWSIAPLIAFFAMTQKGVGLESIMTLSLGLLPLLIFAATFVNKKAKWKITSFDLICGGLSLGGFLLWLLTQEGNIAILFSIVADGLAALPTLRKAYTHPETEIAWPWIANVLGIVLTVGTVKTITFENSGFNIYAGLVGLTVYLFVQFKLGKRFTK